ncbi:hypothetical protein AVEN_112474-1 [Araneus ventricosus]|uniref:Uncharacterized protein n=1 Tax=Araneus ventricosus TaxID=182803 RepID=A0A4Y2DFG1_ARAVE|nr:hypothetical protein AVEN_112474-1 [Araneus ventricosus]
MSSLSGAQSTRMLSPQIEYAVIRFPGEFASQAGHALGGDSVTSSGRDSGLKTAIAGGLRPSFSIINQIHGMENAPDHSI